MTIFKHFSKLILLAILIISCEEAPEEVTIGTEFAVGEATLEITKLESSRVIRDNDKTAVKLAPEGQKIIHFEVKNPDDKMIFLSLFSNGAEVQAETDLTYYTRDLSSGYEDNFYFVDEDIVLDKVSINTPGGKYYNVTNPTISETTSTKINPAVEKLVASYTTEKAAPLVEAFTPFVKDGVNVYDIAFQKGELIPSNVQSNNAEIINISEDGTIYTLKVLSVLGGYSTLTTTWENDKVTKIVVVQ